MTLISNEILLWNGVRTSAIISFADSRLTYRKIKDPKRKYASGNKLFEIKYLNATVSFWGLANLINEKGKDELLCSWLPKFITSRHYHTTLIDFANDLRNEINQKTYRNFLIDEASGFHLAGYNRQGVPEFIHFANCIFNPQLGYYENIQNQYSEPYADFLARDAMEYGWDGADPNSIIAINQTRYYRNGDIRAHVAAWDKLNEVYEMMFTFTDFNRPNWISNDDIIKLTKHKLTFISSMYDVWASTKNVGAPWKIIVLRPPNI